MIAKTVVETVADKGNKAVLCYQSIITDVAAVQVRIERNKEAQSFSRGKKCTKSLWTCILAIWTSVCASGWHEIVAKPLRSASQPSTFHQKWSRLKNATPCGLVHTPMQVSDGQTGITC